MLGEDTTEIFITFLLAIIGYTGLTITLLLSLKRKVPFLLWRIVAVIIFAHVIMVWTYRYGWQFSLAIRNGYAGFIIFHSALMMILFSAFAKESLTKVLIRISFIVVTIGAVGAVFRYYVVEIYKLPVILCAIGGSAGLLWIFYEKRKRLKEMPY
jgi:hypothetical protein